MMGPCLLLLLFGISARAKEAAYASLESEGFLNRTALGYPVHTGGYYEKPNGLCTYSGGRVYGCSCSYRSEPIVFLSNGYAIDAVCAPSSCKTYRDCPPGPYGTVSICADRRCYLSCHQDYQCPWPGRCENAAVIGEVCYFPQWQGMNTVF